MPCVCSVIYHKWRQNVVKTKKWLRRVCHWCFYHILTSSVIYYWTDPRHQGIYLFYRMIRKERPIHITVLAWLFEDLCVPTYFLSLLLLFFLILLVHSFFETFFNVFSCSKENNGENILQNSESLVAITHDGNCCEDLAFSVVSKWCHLPHFKLFLPHLTMSLHLFTHFAKLIRFVQILSLTLVHFHSTHSFAPFDSQVVALIVRRGRNNLKWGRCHHLLTTQK